MAWGNNDTGQTSVPVSAQSGVMAVAAGASHSVALKTNGSVVAWGYNNFGQTTVPVAAQSGVMAIAANENYTLALKTNGSVLSWGRLSGNTTVPVTAQSGVTAIAAGRDHSVALKVDGSVVTWGNNSSGQTTVPTGLRGVTAIAAGNYNTVALFGTSVLMPTLTSRRSGNELVLSWPAVVTGFTLQSSLALAPSMTWNDVANSPALIGGQWTVTNFISDSSRFYRLRKP